MKPSELREKLNNNNWSQAKLARITGVTPRAVAYWMNGGRPIPRYVDTLLELETRARAAEHLSDHDTGADRL